MEHTAHHTNAPNGHTAHEGHGQHEHGQHEHGGHAHRGASWGTAVKATLHCLTGCAIGEIVGMAIGTALAWGNVQTMILAIALAFLFGYSLTLFAVRRAGVDLKTAIKIAIAADTVSIAVMELVDNAIIAVVPGAMDAQLSDGLFWSALLGGFAIAFVITTPVNKWMIGRGKGHAVVHAYH
ncbi:DUF4396 domain-containing protein [Streptomyces olivaceiscleroticus]|uniref:DUF4396 domain-containing protein n=1 Tax=Streptomyces olivaceiscleroticus TaxID=68245 RepID=A0ABN0ZLG1_9ACTN